MRFDISAFMSALASARVLFHSEADFQHAFAWQLHEWLPEARVRLELPTEINGQRAAIDIWVQTGHHSLAIELKYLKARLDVLYAGERFELKNQGAQDTSRYDVIKDIWRLKQLCGERAHASGLAVMLTNDPSFWRPGRGGSMDDCFRLHEGRLLEGVCAWAAHTGAGTIRGREAALHLTGTYRLQWRLYSDLRVPNGQFRYLAVQVG